MLPKNSHKHTRFSHWVISHRRALQFAYAELIRSPIANIITICVIGIALALPLGLSVLLQNLRYVDHKWDATTPTISLFLKKNTTQSQINSFIKSLKNNTEIKKVHYTSPEKGLAEFEKNTPFSSVSDLFNQNPIPSVITVSVSSHIHNTLKVNQLYETLKQSTLVDTAQLDMSWVARLFDIIKIGKTLTQSLSVLFGFAVLFVIGHALRSSLSTHIKEIQVMKLVGASNTYIRRPLLYRGILYGILGGLLSWILVTVFLHEIQKPIAKLAQTYNTPFQLQTISLFSGLSVLLICALLGIASAWLITTQFLNQPEQPD